MQNSKENSKYWFALYTRPRHEFKAQLSLNSMQIENYLPTLTRVKQWSDRKKKVVEPLFKSYIFIKASERERLKAVEIDQVVKTIFFNGKPSVIPESQIKGLKKMLEETDQVSVLEGIVKGTKVKVTEGPFNGVEGIVYSVSKDERHLAITVEMLNRSVIVSLPASSIVKERS